VIVSDEVRGRLAMRLEVLLPHLDERQRRLMRRAEAVGGTVRTSGAVSLSVVTERIAPSMTCMRNVDKPSDVLFTAR